MGNNCCAQDHHCKFQVEKHNILINNTMVKVVHGELVKENVDAIVNSANSKLAHCGGIALAIGNAAGGEMQAESSELVERDGDVEPGEVVVTGGGKLKAKHILHAVSPNYQDGENQEDEVMRKVLLNTYTLANHMELKSISIPAVGTGIFNFPKQQFGELLFDTLTEWLQDNQDTSLKEIRLTNKDLVTVKYISREFQKRFYMAGDRIEIQRRASAMSSTNT